MDNKSKVMEIADTKIETQKVSLEKPLQELFDECLSFISVSSFEF